MLDVVSMPMHLDLEKAAKESNLLYSFTLKIIEVIKIKDMLPTIYHHT